MRDETDDSRCGVGVVARLLDRPMVSAADRRDDQIGRERVGRSARTRNARVESKQAKVTEQANHLALVSRRMGGYRESGRTPAVSRATASKEGRVPRGTSTA